MGAATETVAEHTSPAIGGVLSATMGKTAGAAGDDARLRFTLDGGATLSVHFTVALSALQIFTQEK